MVLAYDKPDDWTTRKAFYAEDHPEHCSHTQAGFVLWKDKKIVTFYSNDLLCTPTNPISGPENTESVRSVRGLAKIARWHGFKVLHRTEFMAPARVVVYNTYMNAVDRMDQHRSTNPTRRREKRLSMTIFSLIIDLAVHNAFALYKVIDPTGILGYQDFKREIAIGLLTP